MAGRNAKSAALILFLCLLALPALAQQRIVSLKPNITEILFELGLGPRVIGVTSYCRRPEGAQKLPKVADYLHVDTERVLTLQPDLVVGSEENSASKEIDFLRRRKIRVELLSFSNLREISDSIAKLGTLTGTDPTAERIRATMQSELLELEKNAGAKSPQRALFVVGYEPLVVAGGKSFIGESSRYLGLKNVAEESALAYPTYSTEQLLRLAPEVIIDLVMGSEKEAKSFEERRRWWQRFQSIPAVREGRILRFDIEKLRAVPSLPQALRELSEKLKPPTVPAFPSKQHQTNPAES